ncbi:MAG TPA: aminotransferase class V-fold PLP-dependent enzyme [Nocardioides sp.]|jgi:glutamate/tyrosine decarboxylase-like PLP-dependent enzyme|nr:aminotransferase class V-fold PLP-dependent enzyme [Nocardioides sp.]
MEARSAALERAREHAMTWLGSLDERPVPPTVDTDEMVRRLGDLPDGPTPSADVVDLLAETCEPGLVAIPSGRFFGMVIGGALPAALGADWLTSAWDQNVGLRALTPAASAAEEVAGRWLTDLLGLPVDAAVGFVTGATMANFTCLAAARDSVLRRAGLDATTGLAGLPRVRVLVGAERHPSVDLPLRFLGLGDPDVVPADERGRIDPDALANALAAADGPTIICLQAGNIHSGDFDPFAECVASAHERGAWVHVDGAFGLWAAASPRWRDAVAGLADADSWATDAHKTLNVPYDSGLAVVRDADALATSMAMHGDYLIQASGDPQERTPELSRRARGFAVWAALRSLGRSGVVDLVERLAGHARAFAEGAREIPGCEVLNDVVFTQVCLAFGEDERTRAVAAALLEDGTTWMSGSRWHDRAIVRISVSNWSTTEDDVRRSLDALRRAAAAVGTG